MGTSKNTENEQKDKFLDMPMNCILFDDDTSTNLLPLTYTRPVAELRFGALTIREKWETMLGTSSSSLTASYLQKKFILKKQHENLLINGSVCPNHELIAEITQLKMGEALVKGDTVIAVVTNRSGIDKFNAYGTKGFYSKTANSDFEKINFLWDLFINNGPAIESDYKLLCRGKTSAPLNDTNNLIGNSIFIEEGAVVEYATINTETGPVYIGKNAEIMEGCLIRGPFFLGENSVLKMGAKIYGPTTVGPYSKVGGEVNNCIIQGFSNKGHDGFLGNSIIGEWCNMGANTNNSNLKNNYSEVSMWSYASEKFENTGLQFCGLIMGDHSKCGINTMFNTGTVIGVNVNIFGAGFPKKFIPSFSWGGADGFTTFNLDKAIETAKKMFERRGKEFNSIDIDILSHIYEATKKNLKMRYAKNCKGL